MRTGLRTWYEDVRDVMTENWQHGLLLGAYYTYVGANLTVTSRRPIGTAPYERDWDALVVLDACRVDAMREVADEFEFIEAVDSVTSVGSTSSEWMAHAFDQRYQDEIEETGMVTANAHSNSVFRERNFPPQYVSAPFAWPDWDPVEPETFALLDEVWEYGWDDESGTVPPRAVTDRAIDAGRHGDGSRLIVHYLQPHAPYVEQSEQGVTALHSEPLESLRRGELSEEKAWEAYLENLRLVLSEVGLLIENLDADRVVLTADHGEAFGEKGFYEHPVSCPHPVVKTVPWIETTATDAASYDPSTTPPEAESTGDTTEQLEALGYV